MAEGDNKLVRQIGLKAAYDNLDGKVSDLKSAFEPIEVGFNHFNGRYVDGYQWVKNKSIAEGKTANDAYISTEPIPVGTTTHLRFRANQKAYYIVSYDANGDYVSVSNYNAYAIAFVQGGYVIYVFESANFDPSTLMIAYTDETANATQDKWSTLFPNQQYEAYKLIPEVITDVVTLQSDVTTLQTNVTALQTWKNNLALTSDAFVDYMATVNNVTITTDSYTGERVVNITAADYTKTWATISFDCKPMVCYLLEFYGKCAYTDYSSNSTQGAFLCIEFFDANNTIIGTKYNAMVLGKGGRKYHRVGAVSPFGAKYVHLRVVTRINGTIELSNVSLRPVYGYTGRTNNGVKIDGHLGCILTAPKNTMPSFELAKIAGYNTVICNVHFTGDSTPIPVCIHDSTIDATSDGTGSVSSFTYNQLLSYDFGSWFNAAYTGTKIPKFEDVLAFMSSNGIRPAVSLHGDQTEVELDVIADLLKRHSVHNALIKSFAYETLTYMYGKLGNDAEYIWDLERTITESDVSSLANIGANTACIETGYSYCNQTIIDLAHSRGIEFSCFSLTDTSQIRQLVLMGIDRICMDFFSDIVVPVD